MHGESIYQVDFIVYSYVDLGMQGMIPKFEFDYKIIFYSHQFLK